MDASKIPPFIEKARRDYSEEEADFMWDTAKLMTKQQPPDFIERCKKCVWNLLTSKDKSKISSGLRLLYGFDSIELLPIYEIEGFPFFISWSHSRAIPLVLFQRKEIDEILLTVDELTPPEGDIIPDELRYYLDSPLQFIVSVVADALVNQPFGIWVRNFFGGHRTIFDLCCGCTATWLAENCLCPNVTDLGDLWDVLSAAGFKPSRIERIRHQMGATPSVDSFCELAVKGADTTSFLSFLKDIGFRKSTRLRFKDAENNPEDFLWWLKNHIHLVLSDFSDDDIHLDPALVWGP